MSRTTLLRFAAGLVFGWLTSFVVLSGGLSLLRAVWADYALAEPTRDYTLLMLGIRLVIFSLMIASTAIVASLVAKDSRLAWLAGGLILAVSIPPHLYPGYIWDEYPAWYHIGYLLSILPIAFGGGVIAQRIRPQVFSQNPSA